jgi:7-cyano-7-deazaguanine synthase in queuosine biosynthesis
MSAEDIAYNKKLKSVFVLWSAGLDSTYLILRLLERGYRVNAGYIDIQNNAKKTAMELDAITKLHAEIDSRFPHFHYLGVVYKAKNNCAGLPDTRGIRYRQVPYFINAFMAVPYTDYRALGYVKGDSSIKNLENIRSVYNAYNLICFRELPELVFPLKEIGKPEIVKYMNEQHPTILAHCVWCENPQDETFKPCGECAPCRRRRKEFQVATPLMEIQ